MIYLANISVFFWVILSFSANAQTLNHRSIDQEDNEKLLGKIDRQGLTKPPFKLWFSKGYRAYKPNKSMVQKIRASLNEYEIKIFLGTWCGDSKREVPRFYKILDKAKFLEEQLIVISLDNEAKSYKQSPSGEEVGLNIHRVPTFIVYQNGEEVGRIVESPMVSLENDLLQILGKKNYEPKYRLVTQIDRILGTKGLDHLKTKPEDLLDQFKDQVDSISELNTYGYVLLFAGNKEAAIEVFKLNTKLFPKEERVYFSLGRGFEMNSQKEDALKNYEKALSISPDSKRIQEMIRNINQSSR